MCDHNSAVAKKLGKHNVALMWSFVKVMYSSATSPKHQQSNELLATGQNLLTGRLMMGAATKSIATAWGDEPADGDTVVDHEPNNDEYLTNEMVPTKHGDFKQSGITNGPHIGHAPRHIGPSMENTSDPLNNIVHGDTELTVEHMDFIKSFRNGFLYIGPHDVSKSFSLPNNSMMNHDMQQTQHSQIESKERRNTSPVCIFVDIMFMAMASYD